MIVVDASVVVELLVGSGHRALAAKERVAAEWRGLLAPHLVDAEVGQVLRRYALGGHLEERRARVALSSLADLPLVRYPHPPLAARAFDLRESVTFYDALYLALAEALEAPLVTCDGSLARVRGHRARVEVLA